MNKIILLGRITKDIELKYTANNNAVANFTVAVNRKFVKQGEERQADFINCVTWGKTAEFVEKYFSKGQMIAVVGELQTRTYDNAEGKKVYVTEVNVSEVYFGGDKAKESANNTTPTTADTGADVIDGLPF